jgi:hypothetical protein
VTDRHHQAAAVWRRLAKELALPRDALNGPIRIGHVDYVIRGIEERSGTVGVIVERTSDLRCFTATVDGIRASLAAAAYLAERRAR